MSKRNLEPYNVKAITHSFQLIFEQHDIDKLTKPAYQFCTLYLGFIAHFNHHVFMDTYRDDLKQFTETIASADVSRYKQDKWFEQEYGKAYCDTIYEIGTAAIRMAKEALPFIEDKQYTKERERAQKVIDQLKERYDL